MYCKCGWLVKENMADPQIIIHSWQRQKIKKTAKNKNVSKIFHPHL